ncbi:MAG: nitroreductase family protein [Candidatus Heimdallarchaeota archaeon]
MEILEAIKTRRSIRKFTDKKVSKEDINTLICRESTTMGVHSY